MIKTRGLRHIQFAVRDGERALAFWRDLLGAEEQFREGSLIFISIPGGDDLITLHESADLAGKPGGVVHFGFVLEPGVDVAGAVAQIEAAGGRVLRTGVHDADKPFIYFMDPDGYEIELFTP
jgi:catechol 2,3-dioxygenase-like lactoylglutathione lyase family enzyme